MMEAINFAFQMIGRGVFEIEYRDAEKHV